MSSASFLHEGRGEEPAAMSLAILLIIKLKDIQYFFLMSILFFDKKQVKFKVKFKGKICIHTGCPIENSLFQIMISSMFKPFRFYPDLLNIPRAGREEGVAFIFSYLYSHVTYEIFLYR